MTGVKSGHGVPRGAHEPDYFEQPLRGELYRCTCGAELAPHDADLPFPWPASIQCPKCKGVAVLMSSQSSRGDAAN